MGGLDGRAATPVDFFPHLLGDEEEQTPNAQLETLTFLAAIYRADADSE